MYIVVSPEDSNRALSETVIGGSDGIGSQLGFNVEEGARKFDVKASDSRDIFRDIEETLTPKNSFISTILSSGRDLHVPEFQRKYSWEAENHDEFWASVMDVFSQLNEAELSDGALNLDSSGNNSKIEESYFGTIYLAESTNEKTGEDIYEVIDGQQRLATVFIILNEINSLLKEYKQGVKNSDAGSSDVLKGIDYFQAGIVQKVLYANIINDGNADYLRLKMTDHDNPYFKIIFDDEISRIVSRLEALPDGSAPHWRIIRKVIEEDLQRGEKLDDLDLDDVETDRNYNSLKELLDESRYRADPHTRLLDARNEYEQYLQALLNEELELDEDAYRERALVLINLSILLLSSFRIIECKFSEPVDETLKIDVFQSLNETGKSLELHDKIRARVVAKFNMGSDEAKWFDELVQKFGENSDKIKDYLVDYLLAIESDKIYKKGTVSQNLLQAFSTRSSNRRPIDSKLVETDDHNPRDFIRAINEHADKYNEISSDSEEPGVSLNDAYFSTDQIQHECEAIIEDLDSEQWKPFVLLMYIELAQGSPIVSETFFRDMLRLVERIMLRSSFSPAVATAIDKTFIAACVKYNTTSIPEFDKISVYDSDEEWIEEIDEFSDDPKRNMEAHMIQAQYLTKHPRLAVSAA
jgi:uncharacterized protein with ParB-like and HNH nuclease domain